MYYGVSYVLKLCTGGAGSAWTSPDILYNWCPKVYESQSIDELYFN